MTLYLTWATTKCPTRFCTNAYRWAVRSAPRKYSSETRSSQVAQSASRSSSRSGCRGDNHAVPERGHSKNPKKLSTRKDDQRFSASSRGRAAIQAVGGSVGQGNFRQFWGQPAVGLTTSTGSPEPEALWRFERKVWGLSVCYTVAQQGCSAMREGNSFYL